MNKPCKSAIPDWHAAKLAVVANKVPPNKRSLAISSEEKKSDEVEDSDGDGDLKIDSLN